MTSMKTLVYKVVYNGINWWLTQQKFIIWCQQYCQKCVRLITTAPQKWFDRYSGLNIYNTEYKDNQ